MKKPAFIRRLWLLFPVAVCVMLAVRLCLSPVRFIPAEFFSSPPAEAEEEAQEAPQPARRAYDGAVSIRAGGISVVTLHTAEDALALLERVLGRAEAPPGETLVRASFARDVELVEAQAGETPVTLEQAGQLLAENPALCPVRIVSRAVTRVPVSYAVRTKTDARLLKDARMVVCAGRAGEEVVITEAARIDGVLVHEESTRVSMPPVDEIVAIGTYAAQESEAGPGEGVRGPAAPAGFSMGAACAAEAVSGFGLYAGIMRYGMDYGCEVGDDVYAPEAGEVIFARGRGSYGFVVEIDHGGGFVTRLSPVADCALAPGMRVEKGRKIGVLDAPYDEDDTPSLHMELLIDGIPYNPEPYMDEAVQDAGA